jgi:tRNA-binding EMAP/Myf-like protein
MEVDGEKAKRVAQNFLVSAASVKQAYDRIKESLHGLMVDFDIPSIIVSPIVEIFPYNEELDKEISRTPLAEGEEFEAVVSKGVVFSASETDDDDYDDESEVSEVEDSFDSED